MKAVILAGGLGTRISEESDIRPKPMIEIGGRPILWHIMNHYAHHGIREFIICLGYKGYLIKEFFINYYSHVSDLRINLATGEFEIINSVAEDITVTLIETGESTMTAGRLKRVARFIGNETFCMTYGDGLSDIDITAEVEFHRRHGRLATVAAVRPPGRFGVLKLNSSNIVTEFSEKPEDEIGWINGGFFILEPKALEFIEGDGDSWELQPLTALATAGQLVAFPHLGFWKPCDTLRDKRELEALWSGGSAPWTRWGGR